MRNPAQQGQLSTGTRDSFDAKFPCQLLRFAFQTPPLPPGDRVEVQFDIRTVEPLHRRLRIKATLRMTEPSKAEWAAINLHYSL
jgi:hypothetical protein